jgi:hemolysin activation/secretion protein
MNKHSSPFQQVGLTMALAMAGLNTWAQGAPNSGSILQQAQPPAVPAEPVPSLPSLGDRQAMEPAMAPLPPGQAIPVRAIQIQGNHVIDTEQLAPLVAEGVGKSLQLPELDSLAQRITRYYRSRGYFVARAYIPAQDITAGVLRIQVVEGRYGSFQLQNSSRVGDPTVQAILDQTKASAAVSAESLERSLLIINDTPGVRVERAEVLPGEQVGSSGFVVATGPTAPFSGYLMGDNFGSRYTGSRRLSFNLESNSPTGRGDRLSVSGLVSDTGELVSGRLAYSMLLAADGLRGEVAASQLEYELGDAYASLNARGTARTLEATLSYPLRRVRAQTIEASLNARYRDLEDKMASAGIRTPKTLSSATAQLALRDETPVFGMAGATQGQVAVSLGELKIGDATARALDAAGPRTQGGYQKLAVDLNRVMLLPWAVSVTGALRHQRSLNGKNLDSSEYLPVSGFGAVMAYPSGELLGANATLVRLELSRPLPAWGSLRSRWQVFADWGQASAARPVSASDRRRKISDAGLGWSGSYDNFLVKAYLANRLNSQRPSSEPYPRTKLLVQAGWVF